MIRGIDLYLNLTFQIRECIYPAASHAKKLRQKNKKLSVFLFPCRQYLVPSFLTRAVLCAGKEAWKRRPFLLSSQICSNYRITSICGSLAAFLLPPPPLSTLLFSLFPSPHFFFSFAFSPIAHFLLFKTFLSYFLSTILLNHKVRKFLIIRTSCHFWQLILVIQSVHTW